eukprot:2595144-Ditylum_brightwellii.AAC.1
MDLECLREANGIIGVGGMSSMLFAIAYFGSNLIIGHNKDQGILVIRFVLKKLRRRGGLVAVEIETVVMGIGMLGTGQLTFHILYIESLTNHIVTS